MQGGNRESAEDVRKDKDRSHRLHAFSQGRSSPCRCSDGPLSADLPQDRHRIGDLDVVRFNVYVVAVDALGRTVLIHEHPVHGFNLKVDLGPGIVDALDVLQCDACRLGQGLGLGLGVRHGLAQQLVLGGLWVLHRVAEAKLRLQRALREGVEHLPQPVVVGIKLHLHLVVIFVPDESPLIGVLLLVALVLRVHVEVQGLQVRPLKPQPRQQILDLFRVLSGPARASP